MKLLITGASGFIGSRLLTAACAAFGVDNVIAFSSKKIDACQSIVYSGPDFNLSPADHALLATVEVLIHAGAFTPKSGPEANALEKCNGNIHFTEKLLGLPHQSGYCATKAAVRALSESLYAELRSIHGGDRG